MSLSPVGTDDSLSFITARQIVGELEFLTWTQL